MSQIIKKSDASETTEWNPFRAMREMLRWDPFREMAPAFGQAWNPNFEVTESKDSFLFKADVPGVKKEDLEISVTGNRLQISGKRDAETETRTDAVYTYERQYGTFGRVFTLPDGVDLEHATSDLKDGVLTLVVPKFAEMKAKKIAITAGPKS